MSSAAADVITAIGTVAVGISGAIAGLRVRRDAMDRAELRRLDSENDDLRADVVALVEYLFRRRIELARQGIRLHDPPPLRSARGQERRAEVE